VSIKPTPNEEAIHESYMDMVNRLMERIEDLERENMDLRQRLGMEQVFDLPTEQDCAFCNVNKATVHTTCDDFTCESCKQEFEDALNTGDTDEM
jgi:hypothetical protein